MPSSEPKKLTAMAPLGESLSRHESLNTEEGQLSKEDISANSINGILPSGSLEEVLYRLHQKPDDSIVT